NVYQVAGTSIARTEVNAPITTNIVMLGALCRVTEVLTRQAFEQAIVQSVPKGKDKINLLAFELGYNKVSERK
ncbi:MAG: 2-oxoacid:acceptor oxidoreductase family protein, partial [Desulfobacterales bacterium]